MSLPKSERPSPVKNPSPARPNVRRWVVAMHWAAVFVLLLAPAVLNPWPRWLGVGALLVQTIGNLTIRKFFRRNYARLPSLAREVTNAEREDWPAVTVIVPARNEALSIERAVRSMLALDYPKLEVIAINDGSTDDTGAILDRLAQESSRLRVMHNPPVREGWHGKANAIWSAVQEVRDGCPWLLLTDADTVFEPRALRAGMAIALESRLDFLTAVVYLENGSVWEELVMPNAWSGLVISAKPIHPKAKRMAPIGVGPFNLVRRQAYLESGGHSVIRGRQPEDGLLAEAVHHWGGNLGVAVAERQVRVRIYRGYRDMRDVLVRKARIQSLGRNRFLSLRLAYVLLQEVLPLPVALVCLLVAVLSSTRDLSWAACGMAAAMAYLSYGITVRDFRRLVYMRPLLEWLHPVAGVLRASFIAKAIRENASGRAMTWRGRPFKMPDQDGA